MASRQALSSTLTRAPILFDFLAPSWTAHSLRQLNNNQHPKSFSTSPSSSAVASAEQETAHEPTTAQPTTTATTGTLTPSQRTYLARALRINQAGELAATIIYTSQTRPLVTAHPHLRPLLRHMYAQEAGHLATFNTLLAQHRIRPTALTPVWRAAASMLGWGTAMLGREAAMACTEAVETEIGGHYNDQVRELLRWKSEMSARGEVFPPELEALLVQIRRIRDEELEHLDHAVEHDAREAVAWPVLTGVIRAGCRAAIKVCERV